MAGAFKGRGALSNPPGRFDKLTQTLEHDGWYEEELAGKPETVVLPEPARSIISRNNSPDIGFSQSINPYRGCEHGCIYCYARPSHAYVGLSPGLDFETKLFYKADAAKLLEAELAAPELQMLADHARREHRSLPAARENTEGHPLASSKCWRATGTRARITTKGALVARDVDLLARSRARWAGPRDVQHPDARQRDEARARAARRIRRRAS